ncbi:MAG: right-handed parallel beta-helix repeat-containing protein [Chloroflexota bacterium]
MKLHSLLTKLLIVGLLTALADQPVIGILSPLVAQAQASDSIYLPMVVREEGGYYVDSVNGSDNNTGKSPSQAWKTLARVRTTRLQPGDVVRFKRGQTWTGALILEESGAQGNPITISTYGEGARPILRNPGSSSNHTRAIVVVGDWNVIEGLKVQETYEAGIRLESSADHNIIRDVEVTNTGLGVQINGTYNLFTKSYVHDLHMVVNTPGGTDDYGAVGIVLHGAEYTEVSYNRFERCKASSHDYGFDGGAIEWYADNTNYNYVHHNWAEANHGFLEIGGGSAANNVVSYNVTLNNRKFSLLNLSGQYAAVVRNFRVENNTIVEQGSSEQAWLIFAFTANPASGVFSVRNNIVYAHNFSYVARPSMPNFTHDHNLYYLSGGTRLGITPVSSELQGDPRFINLGGGDFHLQASSPAINAGVDLRHPLDFSDQSVPVGPIPDLGAFEYKP